MTEEKCGCECYRDTGIDEDGCKYPALLVERDALRAALSEMLTVIRENAFIKTGELAEAQRRIASAKALLVDQPQ